MKFNYERYPRRYAGWQNCNPGAGGQVQHVSCDPTVRGRMYLCSDMEGWYVSPDYGDNWIYKGETVPTADTFRVEAEPGNPDRLYLGHARGLSISDDAGATWRDVPELAGMLVGTIAIDPENPATVFVGNSWLEDIQKVTFYQGGPDGPDGSRLVYFSHDRGETWQIVPYTDEAGDRHLYTFSFHPRQAGHVVLGSAAGVFFSVDGGDSWRSIATPPGMVECRGADLTPDGRFLYAVYIDERGKTAVVAREFPHGAWQMLDVGDLAASPTTHWRPLISEHSTDTEHWLLLGPLPTPNDGLYEGHFVVVAGNLQGTFRKILDAPPQINERHPDSAWRIDFGWNRYECMARTYTYYPRSWGDGRRVFTMSQQQAFRGNPAEPYSGWQCVTSHPVWELDGVRFHRTNGTASTYTYDMAGLGSYVIQGQGDNGIIESYDGGYSWSEDMRPGEPTGNMLSNVEGVGIVPLPAPVVLAGGLGACWGGGDIESHCELWAKTLLPAARPYTDANAPDTPNPLQNMPWRLIAHGEAGSEMQHGLPNKRIHVITPDPQRPQRVYLGTQAGIYLIEDIDPLLRRGEGTFRLISEDGPGVASIRELVVDPAEPDTLYVMGGERKVGGAVLGRKGVWRGERAGAEDYRWTQLYPEGCAGNGLGDFTAWRHNGRLYLAGSFELYNGKPWNGDTELKLSVDGGMTWQNALTLDDAFAVVPPGKWYDRDTMEIQFGGLAGYADKLYCTVHSRRIQQTVAFLRGTVSPDGVVGWEDWTGAGDGRFWFPYSRRGKVWADEFGDLYLFQATMGAGLWRRRL